ncbi:hypothetical protein ILYODFUR_027047 [Ilyodon furcidens]|uniref:Uncharacterized protein n=1 Tax=Ilyodon furcidens TaxID=33524 RepID=A0ABV0TCW1_9TELE
MRFYCLGTTTDSVKFTIQDHLMAALYYVCGSTPVNRLLFTGVVRYYLVNSEARTIQPELLAARVAHFAVQLPSFDTLSLYLYAQFNRQFRQGVCVCVCVRLKGG